MEKDYHGWIGALVRLNKAERERRQPEMAKKEGFVLRVVEFPIRILGDLRKEIRLRIEWEPNVIWTEHPDNLEKI